MALVCVTGGSGFLASWLIKVLLERGYSVRATVRDPGNQKKIAHLQSLPGAPDRLEFVKADLLHEGSFDNAVAGCEGVFHVASPVKFVADNPEADLIIPAIKGTLNVLNACAKSKCLKRVVLTSSIAAVSGETLSRSGSIVVDESCWSSEAYLKERNDVVEAHLLAFEMPTASGRYICGEQVMDSPTLLQVLQKIIPGHALSPKYADNPLPPATIYKVSTKKIQKLGLTWTPIEDVLKETVKYLLEKRLLPEEYQIAS